MRVHAERYRRWTARGNWLAVDTSIYLRAARDILLVEGGIWHYNEMNPWMWEVVKELPSTTPDLMRDIIDVKLLDDRKFCAEKAVIMERLIATLAGHAAELCERME